MKMIVSVRKDGWDLSLQGTSESDEPGVSDLDLHREPSMSMMSRSYLHLVRTQQRFAHDRDVE